MNDRFIGRLVASLCIIGVILVAGVIIIAVRSFSHRSLSYHPDQIDDFANREKQYQQVHLLAERGVSEAGVRQYDKAIRDFTAALAMLNGHDEEANAWRAKLYNFCSTAYMFEHRDRQAVADLHNMFTLPLKEPELPQEIVAASNNQLAWLQATSPDVAVQNGKEAIHYAEQAVALVDNKQSAMYIDTLAAAEARVGNFTLAVTKQQQAIALTPDGSEKTGMQQRLHQYQLKQPYIEHYSAL